MTTFEILVAIYMAVVPPALGALFWARLNRLEIRMDSLETSMRADIRDVERSIRTEIRQESASVRSDLTQVALAVGAPPHASEG